MTVSPTAIRREHFQILLGQSCSGVMAGVVMMALRSLLQEDGGGFGGFLVVNLQLSEMHTLWGKKYVLPGCKESHGPTAAAQPSPASCSLLPPPSPPPPLVVRPVPHKFQQSPPLLPVLPCPTHPLERGPATLSLARAE